MKNLMSEQRRGGTPVADQHSGQQRESRDTSLACYRAWSEGLPLRTKCIKV